MKSSDTQMELVRRYLDGEATLEEARRLESMLAVDAQLRRDYLAYARVEAGLSSKVRPKLVKTAPPNRWFYWRPLTAAAAGVVFGLFCASIAWAYAGGRVVEIVERVVAVVNGGFENGQEPLPDGMPNRFDVWSGDYSRIVGAEQGIVPQGGDRMLRILRSDSRVDPSWVDSHGGDMMQLVDLRPLKSEFATGNAVLEVSAAANMIAPQPGDEFSFAVAAAAFSGRPEDSSKEHGNLLQAALASGLKRTRLDHDPASWQTVTTRVLLPSDTDFLLVKLTFTCRRPQPPGHVEFAGHYVDGVKLMLQTQPARQVHIVTR